MSEGHNSGVAVDQLRQYVERIERLQEERKALGDDISDVFKEAKGTGFDTTAMKAVIRLRAQDETKRSAHESMVDLYRSALGV